MEVKLKYSYTLPFALLPFLMPQPFPSTPPSCPTLPLSSPPSSPTHFLSYPHNSDLSHIPRIDGVGTGPIGSKDVGSRRLRSERVKDKKNATCVCIHAVEIMCTWLGGVVCRIGAEGWLLIEQYCVVSLKPHHQRQTVF